MREPPCVIAPGDKFDGVRPDRVRGLLEKLRVRDRVVRNDRHKAGTIVETVDQPLRLRDPLAIPQILLDHDLVDDTDPARKRFERGAI